MKNNTINKLFNIPSTAFNLKTKNIVFKLVFFVSIAIFFQFYIKFSFGTINVNLADPFAIAAIIFLIAISLKYKHLPDWRIKEFNILILSISLLLTFSYIIGWSQIGITQWALFARLIGWLILLGYLAAGYLIVSYGGSRAIRRIYQAMTLSAILVIVWHIFYRMIYIYGFDIPTPTINFEGFSKNRNAFSFCILSLMSLSLSYTKFYNRLPYKNLYRLQFFLKSWIKFGFFLTAIILTGSRAGILTFFILLALSFYKKIICYKDFLKGCSFAALLLSSVWLTTILADNLPAGDAQIQIQKKGYTNIQSPLSSEESNQERLKTIKHAIQMWIDSPLYGQGLGVFAEKSPSWFGHSTVIHNTPLWILAEFGLLGIIVFGSLFLRLFLYCYKTSKHNSDMTKSAFFLLLSVAVVFSQFHEMFFQRVFWFLTGALLAMPSSVTSRNLLNNNKNLNN